ncbi:serine hydrolase [Jeotgalibacillus sp. R-1-5s-1]|uniref:serine hydrolase n=1 Tax=Jeotgalibacillus sp. R-1-5s-1 TaxID=2555897 RepID=UPI001FC7D190|nr:serine hydrolase [Jeotgalibacillus sp. R-1-5s-1]
MNWVSIGAILLVSFIAFGVVFLMMKTRGMSPKAFVEFIKKNKEYTAVKIVRNDETVVSYQEEKMLPLASTAKMIIAVAYAKQAAAGEIDPNEKISLSTLNSFFIRKTDGGAHEAWLSEINNQDPVTLAQVAEGMMHYSSNANTDYLLHRLGLERVNEVPAEIGIADHEDIYPFVPALAIPYILMEEQNITLTGAIAKVRDMPLEEYREKAVEIMNQWLEKPLPKDKKLMLVKSLIMDVQKIWSDRLPRSNAKSYADFMKKLNDKTFFSQEVHEHLDPLLEPLMSSPENQTWLKHAGKKGGSTAMVLTFSMYATDLEGNRTEAAFFTDQLMLLDQVRLSKSLNEFQKAILKDENFRRYCQDAFRQD